MNIFAIPRNTTLSLSFPERQDDPREHLPEMSITREKEQHPWCSTGSSPAFHPTGASTPTGIGAFIVIAAFS